jgi:large subunit ribosomal protein L4
MTEQVGGPEGGETPEMAGISAEEGSEQSPDAVGAGAATQEVTSEEGAREETVPLAVASSGDGSGLRARRVLVSGEVAGEVPLDPAIFGATPNIALLHQVVVAEEANARRGTHSTKTRAEVSGGGAKPYRQKGTGNARQGSTRAPQFTGGGIVHGPKPRSYQQDTPKKMVRAALRQALSDRARHDRVFLLAGEFAAPSTKAARRVLEATELVTEHVALVVGPAEEQVVLSFRNLPQIVVAHPGSLLTGTVLASDAVLVTEAGLAGLGERLGSKER